MQVPRRASLLKGINDRIKFIERMADGFRDHNYFSPKLRAAFPGFRSRTGKMTEPVAAKIAATGSVAVVSAVRAIARTACSF